MTSIVLIVHKKSFLNSDVLVSWANKYFELKGVIYIEEESNRKVKRFKSELKRTGIFGIVDVFLFKVYYLLFLKSREKEKMNDYRASLLTVYPPLQSQGFSSITVKNPNGKVAVDFLKKMAPTFVLARCKFILKKSVFSLPQKGTFILHPGICPQYRNSHGCFWAIVKGDFKNVGMSLMQIDKGIDTGPIYHYFFTKKSMPEYTHNEIQARVVYDNLELIAEKFVKIMNGELSPINPVNSKGGLYGQPRLTNYLKQIMR